MTRWLAPLGAAVSLLVLFVGLVRAEADTATVAGVSMVLWGATGLLLIAAVVGAVELTAARRAAVPRTAARRPAAPRRASALSPDGRVPRAGRRG